MIKVSDRRRNAIGICWHEGERFEPVYGSFFLINVRNLVNAVKINFWPPKTANLEKIHLFQRSQMRVLRGEEKFTALHC